LGKKSDFETRELEARIEKAVNRTQREEHRNEKRNKISWEFSLSRRDSEAVSEIQWAFPGVVSGFPGFEH